MKNVSFYHRETGLFSDFHLTTSDDSLIAPNTPPDHLPIHGHHDRLSKRVDVQNGGNVVEYQPPRESEEHDWNDKTKRWELSPAAAAKRAKRSAAIARIGALETAQPRLVREALLELMTGQDTAKSYQRIAGLEDEIKTLREDLK